MRQVLLAMLGLGIILVLTQFYTNGRLLSEVKHLLSPQIDEPVSLTITNVAKISRTKCDPKNPTNCVSLELCQNEGESWEDFLKRFESRWEDLCNMVGY